MKNTTTRRSLFLILLIIFLSVFLLTTTCCISTVPDSQQTVISNIDNAYKSTWDVLDTTGTRSTGAAVVIRWELNEEIQLLSAAHVFAHRKAEGTFILQYCRMPNNNPCVTKNVTIARIDEAIDLVLLVGTKKETIKGPSVPFAQKEPLLGENVYVIGAPLQSTRLITHGIISNILWEENRKNYLTDAAIVFGNSGGGLFNTKGELLGIVVAAKRVPIRIGPFLTYGGVILGFSAAVGLPHLYAMLQK